MNKLAYKKTFLFVFTLSLYFTGLTATAQYLNSEEEATPPPPPVAGLTMQQASRAIDARKKLPPEHKQRMKGAVQKALNNKSVQKMMQDGALFSEKAKDALKEAGIEVEEENQGPARLGHAIVFLEFAKPFCMETIFFMSKLGRIEGLSSELALRPMTKEEIILLKQGKLGSLPENETTGYESHLSQEQLEWIGKKMQTEGGEMPQGKIDQGNLLAQKYGITHYPSLVYVAPDNEVFTYKFIEHEANPVFNQFFKPIEKWNKETERKGRREKAREKYYGKGVKQ